MTNLSTKANASMSNSCSLTLPEFAIYFYVQPSICIIGLILNIVNCVVFHQPQFVGPAYKFMIALAMADALTLFVTFPIGFQRCKGFLSSCLHPNFKFVRLIVSYYTTHIQFPVANASETASIFLTTLLAIERYLTMHKLNCSTKQKMTCYLRRLFRCVRGHSNSNEQANRPDFCKLSCECGSAFLYKLLTPINRMCSLSNDNIKGAFIKVVISSIVLNIPLFFAQRVYIRYNNDTAMSISTIRGWRVDVTTFGQSIEYSVYTWLRTGFLQIVPLLFLCIINFYLFTFIRMVNKRWRTMVQQKPQSKSVGKSNQKRILGFNNAEYSIDCQQTSKELQPILNTSTLATLKNNRRQAAQRKLTVLLIAIVCLFLAGQIPQALAFASIYQGILSPTSLKCSPTYRLYRVITHCVCLLTYSANFFIYATLNSHFKNQLIKWMPFWQCCQKKIQPRIGSLKLNPYYEGTAYLNTKKPRICIESKSVDCVHTNTISKQFIMGPVSDILPMTLPHSHDSEIGHSTVSMQACSDQVWRASVAVLSKKGGRPIAIATATLNRPSTYFSSQDSLKHVCGLQAISSSGISSLHQSDPGQSSYFFSPLSFDGCRQRIINENTNHLNSANTLLNPNNKKELNLCPEERTIFRISSHSKRFWVKRWKTLGKQYIKNENNADHKAKLSKLGYIKCVQNNNPLFLQLATQNFQSSKIDNDRRYANIILQSNESLLASSILNNIQQECKLSPLLHNHLQNTYNETHLDNNL